MLNNIIHFLGLFSRRVRLLAYRKGKKYSWGLLKFIEDNPQPEKAVFNEKTIDNLLNLFKE